MLRHGCYKWGCEATCHPSWQEGNSQSWCNGQSVCFRKQTDRGSDPSSLFAGNLLFSRGFFICEGGWRGSPGRTALLIREKSACVRHQLCTWHGAVIIIRWQTPCYLHCCLTETSQQTLRKMQLFPLKGSEPLRGSTVCPQARSGLLHLRPAFSVFPGCLAASPCFLGHPVADVSIRRT